MISLEKKTFEVSNIKTNDELNSLSIKLNEREQVSHIKINKESIVFNCIDIEPLLSVIHNVNKEFVVNEVIDGQKRTYDFAQRKETKHYFMFRNMITEDDIQVLIKRLLEDSKYQNVEYDSSNKVLMLTTHQKDVISYLRKELFRINPSIEIFEHRKPIRSQDVFNEKYLHTYIRIGIFLVIVALAVITSKDHTFLTPILWFATVILLSEPIWKKAWQDIKSKRFLQEDVLILCAFIMGVVAGAYIETCITVLLYLASTPVRNKVLYYSLNKIDSAVEMPEKAMRIVDGKEEEISLYDFEIGDILVLHPGETVPIPGVVSEGETQISTYSNTSTYELEDVKAGAFLHSGDVNAGENAIYLKVNETYESSNFIELMNIASVAPVYESKIEKYTKIVARFYTPIMILLGIILGIILPVIDFQKYGEFIHVGAILLVLSGALSSDQSTSLGMLSGFAKAFQNGIIIESSKGLDSINATQTIIYDRFDGVEVTEEELELFKKLSHMGRTLVIFNDGPVALENDQYTIYNDLTVAQKLEKMDTLIGPIVYIGDSFKDIELLQKSYVGISRGGLADSKVVENSDIVLIDADLNKVYETFAISRKMRSTAIFNNFITIFMKLVVLIVAVSLTTFPLWAVIIIEIFISSLVMYNATHILE